DPRTEPKNRVVGAGDDFVDRLETDCSNHWAKDFFLYDPHVVPDTGKDRGLDEISVAKFTAHSLATGDNGCAFFFADIDIAQYAIKLTLGGDGPDLGLW